MMGQSSRDQGQLFYSFNLEEVVPDDHPVRAIADVLDLSWVRAELAPHYSSEVTPKFVSPSDPAARWTGALRDAAFFAYADNYLIDVKFGIIMDVEASRAIRQAEVGAS